jgi:hypothetical protein
MIGCIFPLTDTPVLIAASFKASCYDILSADSLCTKRASYMRLLVWRIPSATRSHVNFGPCSILVLHTGSMRGSDLHAALTCRIFSSCKTVCRTCQISSLTSFRYECSRFFPCVIASEKGLGAGEKLFELLESEPSIPPRGARGGLHLPMLRCTVNVSHKCW